MTPTTWWILGPALWGAGAIVYVLVLAWRHGAEHGRREHPRPLWDCDCNANQMRRYFESLFVWVPVLAYFCIAKAFCAFSSIAARRASPPANQHFCGKSVLGAAVPPAPMTTVYTDPMMTVVLLYRSRHWEPSNVAMFATAEVLARKGNVVTVLPKLEAHKLPRRMIDFSLHTGLRIGGDRLCDQFPCDGDGDWELEPSDIARIRNR